jgi:cytochrome c553
MRTLSERLIAAPGALRGCWQAADVLLIALLLFAATFGCLTAQPAAAQAQRGVEIIERALKLQPDLAEGRKLYIENCASCHGPEAYGNAHEVIPALAGQLPIYVIKQLADVAEGLRTTPEMHRVVARKPLSTPQGLKNVASYVGSLDPNPRPETGDGKQLALGKRYYQGLCAYCHGAQGGGNEAHATPALRRQNYSYLLMQMRDLSSGHRYAVDETIVATLQELSYDQLTAIADYAARLPMANTPVDMTEYSAPEPQ